MFELGEDRYGISVQVGTIQAQDEFSITHPEPPEPEPPTVVVNISATDDDNFVIQVSVDDVTGEDTLTIIHPEPLEPTEDNQHIESNLQGFASFNNDRLTISISIKGILDGANGGNNPVVCIKLLGEQANNLNDELGVAYDGTTFAVTHKAPSDALKQNYVSGVISYETDGNRGATVFQSIRSITEKATEDFAAQLGTVPADCRLNVLDVLSCPNGRRNPRDHRRFNLFFATRVDPADAAETAQTETIELPVAGAGALDILACANAAAALTGLYCIGYTGENYDRFHKLLV